MALSLPSIADDFNIDIETAAWILIAELLALGATVYLAAKLGDKYGRNRAFFLGTVVTTLGAVAAGFSQDFTQLIVFRGIQGDRRSLCHRQRQRHPGGRLRAGVFSTSMSKSGRRYVYPWGEGGIH